MRGNDKMLNNKVVRYQYGSPFPSNAVVMDVLIYKEPLQKLVFEEGGFTYKLKK